MPSAASESRQEWILILAPLGRDAELACRVLADAGLQPVRCRSMEELVGHVRKGGCGAILLAEEALSPSVTAQLQSALAEQPTWSDLPIVLLTSGGSVTEISREAVDFFGPSGNVTLLERPIRVMTLTRTLQVALRARRRQYEVRDLLHQREQVLASIRDAFAILDREWRYTYVNEQTCELCQMTAEQMLGQKIWELFPGAVGTNLDTELRRAMAERAAVAFEYHNERWERWFSIRVYPSDDGLSLLTVEITEQKKMEAVLLESERRLHLALDTSQLGMWYCDLPFDKIVGDANFKKLFGLAPEAEVDFPRFYSILHPDDRERTRRAIESAVFERTEYDIEYRAIHPDGDVHWIHAIGRAFYREEDGTPQRFDGVTIDVSERKRTELELERARKEAIDANHAKDHFLAALSHELRTPLTPVLMTVAALQQDSNVPDHVRADLEMIHRNVELEARLIDDLLDLTRVTRGKLILHREILDVNELMRHAEETCCEGGSAETRAKVVLRPEAEAHHTFGDPARLHQVLCNLLNNAVKFTPREGCIELISRNPEPGVIEICVSDSGMGIAPELLPRLFDAFEQGNVAVTRRFGGLGLGLAISKAIVDFHGGTLRAESAGIGKGATFSVRMSSAVPAEHSPVVEPAAPVARAQPLRILLTEDNEPTRQILTRLLTRAGHSVREAACLSDALRLVDEEEFDLLLSDLGLPDGSGVDLMKAVRAKCAMPAIALSGYGMEEDIQASTAAGFSMHLTKPVDWRRLESALHRLSAVDGEMVGSGLRVERKSPAPRLPGAGKS